MRWIVLAGVVGAVGGCAASPSDGGAPLSSPCGPVCDVGVFAVGDAYVVEVPVEASADEVGDVRLELEDPAGDFVAVEAWLAEGETLPEGVWDPTTDGRTIPAGERRGYPVIFRPDLQGFHQVQAVVRSERDDPSTGPVALTLRAQAEVPDVAVYPYRVDFGLVPVGQVGTAEVVVDNAGDLTARLHVDLSTPSLFAADASELPPLEPGEARTVTLTYTPRDDAPRTGDDLAVFRLGDTVVQRVALLAHGADDALDTGRP